MEKAASSLSERISIDSSDKWSIKDDVITQQYDIIHDVTGDVPPLVGVQYRRGTMNWSQISRHIGESLSLHLKATVMSLPDVPSNNRVASSFQMSINLQTMILGTSLLSLPFCLRIAGVWALLVTVVIGFFTTFTASILSDCQYQVSYSQPAVLKRVSPSYVEMAKLCWKQGGGRIMELLVYLGLLRNVVVLILLTDITRDLLSPLGLHYDKRYLTIIWTLILLPLLFIKKIQLLTIISFVGLNVYMLAILTILVSCCVQSSTWNIFNISFAFNLRGFGLVVGIVVNSFAVHLNLPALEGSLKKVDAYHRTTLISFLVNICAKIGFAMCGYLTCLEETGQEITSRISLYPPLPILVKISVMFFAFFSVPLQNLVIFQLIDDKYRPHFPVFENRNLTWVLLTRSLCVTACLFVAVSVPHFSIAVSLIGSLRGSLISLILPPLFYITLNTHHKKRCKKCLCYVTITVGVGAALFGAYSSFAALVYGDV